MRTHGYYINLIMKITVKNKMSLWYRKKEKFFKFYFSDVWIKIMIKNDIYCYIDGFLKWNISKKSSYIVRNTELSREICILNLRNKRKRIFARIIIRNWRWKKITKEMGKIIIKSTYRSNNWTKFRERITKREFVHFRSPINTSRNRARKIQFNTFNFIKKGIICTKHCSEASRFKVESSLSFLNLEVSEIISWIVLS